MSLLKKYHRDPTHILQLKDIELDEFVTYNEWPVQLHNRKVKELKNKRIPLVKVLWKNHDVEEAAWELEENMQKKYSALFASNGTNFEIKILLKGRECEDPTIMFYIFSSVWIR